MAPLIRGLVRLGVTPNAITVAGLAGSVGAAALILGHHWIAAGVVYVAASLLDSLDGAVARESGRASTFGAFFDSTLDRLAEGIVLGAIGVTLAQDDAPVAVGACFVALTGSFLVSYTRARAEGLGVTSNKGGLMSRPERIVLTAAGLFFAPFDHVLEVMVYVLAALTVVTVVQRLDHVRRALAEEPGPVPEKETNTP
jgi:phosphatidylinositol phosphate synthase